LLSTTEEVVITGQYTDVIDEFHSLPCTDHPSFRRISPACYTRQGDT